MTTTISIPPAAVVTISRRLLALTARIQARQTANRDLTAKRATGPAREARNGTMSLVPVVTMRITPFTITTSLFQVNFRRHREGQRRIITITRPGPGQQPRQAKSRRSPKRQDGRSLAPTWTATGWIRSHGRGRKMLRQQIRHHRPSTACAVGVTGRPLI